MHLQPRQPVHDSQLHGVGIESAADEVLEQLGPQVLALLVAQLDGQPFKLVVGRPRADDGEKRQPLNLALAPNLEVGAVEEQKAILGA
jgi:hypothetical protein